MAHFFLELNPATVQLPFHRSFFASMEEYKELLADCGRAGDPGDVRFRKPAVRFQASHANWPTVGILSSSLARPHSQCRKLAVAHALSRLPRRGSLAARAR